MDTKSEVAADKTQSERKPSWRFFLTFLGITILHLSLGASFIVGNIIPYVVSYIRLIGKDTIIKYADGIWLSSMATTGFGVSMLFTTYIEKVLGLKKTILFGSLIQSVSTLVSYFTIRSSYYLFVITEGFCTGAGCAIPYVVTVSCAMKWLPHRKASAAGFVLFSHGMSAFIFNFVSTKFINPENYQENEFIDGEAYFNQKDLLARVPKCFLMLGGIFLISQIISVCLISNPKEEMNVIREDTITVDDSVESGKENKAFQENEAAIQSKNQPNYFKTKNIQEDDKQEEMSKSPTAAASQKETYFRLYILYIHTTGGELAETLACRVKFIAVFRLQLRSEFKFRQGRLCLSSFRGR
uniref:Major facilitator superfamily (MFS) profile domain-containing protein n=1 Tax=Octopus bimaculoides TaxID=37653 RepID=A0A0L8H654_OCTBM